MPGRWSRGILTIANDIPVPCSKVANRAGIRIAAPAGIAGADSETLARAGYPDASVKTVLSPPWTTDWIDEDGRAKLLEFGIAPPEKASSSKQALFGPLPEIACPQCGSKNTEMVSEFGSTACKALYKCGDCREPFDYFKCI